MINKNKNNKDGIKYLLLIILSCLRIVAFWGEDTEKPGFLIPKECKKGREGCGWLKGFDEPFYPFQIVFSYI